MAANETSELELHQNPVETIATAKSVAVRNRGKVFLPRFLPPMLGFSFAACQLRQTTPNQVHLFGGDSNVERKLPRCAKNFHLGNFRSDVIPVSSRPSGI